MNFKKIFKNVLLVTLLIVLLPIFNIYASGTNNSQEYQEYLDLIKDDVLGEDVSFEYWTEFKKESERLEKIFEESDDFNKVYDSGDDKSANAKYTMQQGDVFITNGTSSYGLTGHAGIAISSSKILHIAGKDEVPDTLYKWKWDRNYTKKGWTKVYRHKDNEIANKAGDWANDTYTDSKAKYKINRNLESTNETYCSKIVFQAYYYAKHNDLPKYKKLISPYALSREIDGLRLKIKY